MLQSRHLSVSMVIFFAIIFNFVVPIGLGGGYGLCHHMSNMIRMENLIQTVSAWMHLQRVREEDKDNYSQLAEGDEK